jgi:hypothetical protein
MDIDVTSQRQSAITYEFDIGSLIEALSRNLPPLFQIPSRGETQLKLDFSHLRSRFFESLFYFRHWSAWWEECSRAVSFFISAGRLPIEVHYCL